jgi:hypothetical protein
MGLQREIQEANEEDERLGRAKAEDSAIIAEHTDDDEDFHGFGHGRREKQLTPDQEREMQLRLEIARLKRK